MDVEEIETHYMCDQVGKHALKVWGKNRRQKAGNITFNCLFEVDGMKISEWEFLKLLFNSEEKLVKRVNKREKMPDKAQYHANGKCILGAF